MENGIVSRLIINTLISVKELLVKIRYGSYK